MERPLPGGRLAALTLALADALWLASCAAPTPPPPPETKPIVATTAPAAQVPAPSPAASAPPPSAPEGPPPGSPAAQQLSHRAAMAAVELLEVGNEEQASAELQRALQADPGNKLAQSLLKQIQSDPQALLGREHFIHRVQPGESLSRIAQRFLGDAHLFYALARYNDIRVPRHVQGGQAIKVPGKAPPPPPPSAAATAPAPLPKAVPPATDDKALEGARQAKVTAATRAARSAFARHDLNGAIRNWDVVLELDPDNDMAQLERKKAIELRDKLRKMK